ncbi:hypothetical protein [Streptomyces sp. CHB9.2]|uniref:hypothetical protein n=1 Tax=Streptomyces sp. CHB9.2 TaxID=2841670 RepID=UPI002094FF80|nr:hypothetical protein [Streptomyces sp. CHB9.2]MCO6704691.1 hypothetical protein [Streptomyces sp. CHB9.2]
MTETADRVIVKKDDKIYSHAIDGLIFRKKQFVDEETGVTTILYDEANEEELEHCRRGIYEKVESREYNYSLVRRVIDNGWVYYPLPLVFKTERDRVLQGHKTGTQVPCGRWVRRTRGKVLTMFEERSK